MLYAPEGPRDGDVVDPTKLAEDFMRAANVADRTTQWQWAQSAFTDTTKLADAGAVQVIAKRQWAQTRTNNLNSIPLMPDTAGADPQLWKIPYNRGFAPIPCDTSIAGDMLERTWTAAVPELVWCMLSIQLVHRSITVGTAGWVAWWAANPHRKPRVQCCGELDGVRIPGSGPYAFAFDGTPRRMGTAPKFVSVGTVTMHMVPPGQHTFRAIAAQASALGVDANVVPNQLESETYAETYPLDGICVGNRQIIAVRFPLGGVLPY